MGSQEAAVPSAEVLLAQLQVLNERSRWYSSQLWQVPFLYFAAAGALVGQFLEKQPTFLPLSLLVAGVLGVVIGIHMGKLQDGEERAVKALLEVEVSLGIRDNAKYRKDYTSILYKAIWGTAITLILAVVPAALYFPT